MDDSRKLFQCGRREGQGGVGTSRVLAGRDAPQPVEELLLFLLLSGNTAHTGTPSLKHVGAIRGG